MAQVQRISTGSAVVQAALDRYWGGGQIIWVGNRSGLPAGNGTSPDYPFSSLVGTGGALASLQGTTHRGHVIFVLPGSSFSVDAADWASVTGAANSFAIVGLGKGTSRPSLTWTTATSTWLIDTANVQFDNLQLFWAGAHAAGSALTVAAPMTVSAAGFEMRNCDIKCGFDVDQIVTVGLTTTAAGDDMVIENNRILGEVAAEITAAGTVIRLVGSDGTIIRNNYIAAALATDTDGLIETITTLSANLQVYDNFFYSNGAGSTCALDFGQDLVNTGRIQRNLCVVDADGTVGSVVITQHANSNFALLDNFLVNNNGERGLVIGTASA